MIPPVNSDNITRLVVDSFFLATTLTQRVSEMDRRGLLYPGHRLLELGRRAWGRHERRREMARVMVEKRPTKEVSLYASAKLHAEASALVEHLLRERHLLIEMMLAGLDFGDDMLARADRLYGLLLKAMKRRARRLHTFINEAKVLP